MKQDFISFLKPFFIFSLIIFCTHYVLEIFLFSTETSFYDPWIIHSFLFATTILIFAVSVYVNYNFSDYTGFAFLGGSFMKMLISILFLIPLIQDKEAFNIYNIMVFFVPYFLYLIFETIQVLRIINAKS